MARNALIQVRRDTAANWTSTNPTLAPGEMGFETDTGKLKIGTGSTAWTSLLYSTDASDITGATLASNVTGSSLTSVGTLTSLTVTGESSINNILNVTTVLAAGLGFRVKADSTNASAIIQFTDNAVSAQWSTIVATNNLLSVTTPLAATSFNGSATAATTSTGATGVGYMGLPQNSTTTGTYTLVAADAGKHIYSTATRTITIPGNATGGSQVDFPIGATIVFANATGTTLTLSMDATTTDTCLLSSAGTSMTGGSGSRTLAAFGMATLLKITSTSWIISGNGLT